MLGFPNVFFLHGFPQPPKSLGTQKPKAASWSVTSASDAASFLALSGALAQVRVP